MSKSVEQSGEVVAKESIQASSFTVLQLYSTVAISGSGEVLV